MEMAEVLAAAQRIRGRADATPLLKSEALGARLGRELWLKMELMQPIGAFKLRGALNAIAGLPEGTAGVICCSTGNHGRAVAWAAREAGLRAVVCMSRLVPEAKVAAIRALGAEVQIHGASQDEAGVEAQRLEEAEGLVQIPPFDHPAVIAGQGTIGLEILTALPHLEALLVPLSGGGLAAGVALAAKTLNPGIKVWGVSMDRGAAMHESLAAGHPVPVTEVASLADSLGGGLGAQNRYSFALCRDLLDGTILVTEAQIYRAMQALYVEERLVTEGAAAVGIAALQSGQVPGTGPVATILTGRNTDMDLFSRVVSGQDIALEDYTVKGARYEP